MEKRKTGLMRFKDGSGPFGGPGGCMACSHEDRKVIKLHRLALMLIMIAAALCAFGMLSEQDAYAATDLGRSGSCTLSLDAGTLTVSGSGAMADYEQNGENAFYKTDWYKNLSDVKKIIIKSGVTRIGSNAFYEFEKLETVEFEGSSSLVSIGENAFGKTKITDLKLPASVDTIGLDAFADNAALKSLEICGPSAAIGDGAFSGDTGLISVRFTGAAGGDIRIGDKAFYNTLSLTTLVFPPDAASISIGSNAFETQDTVQTLKNLVFPVSVVSIGTEAFNNRKIDSVVVYDTAIVGAKAFASMTTGSSIFVKYSGNVPAKSMTGGNTGIKLIYENSIKAEQVNFETADLDKMVNAADLKSETGGSVTVGLSDKVMDTAGVPLSSDKTGVTEDSFYTVANNTTVLKLTPVPDAGYAFDKWYKKDEASGALTELKNTSGTVNKIDIDSKGVLKVTNPQATEEYTVRFKRIAYDLTLNLQAPGAEFAATGDSKIYADNSTEKNGIKTSAVRVLASTEATAASISIPEPADTGYEFAGWAGKAGASVSEVIYGKGAPVPVSKNTTLYAVWKFDVSYDANYVSGIDPSRQSGTMTTPEPVVFNQSGDLPDCGYSLKGYSFGGWFASRECTGTQYKTYKQLCGESPVKQLYAKWIRDVYTVSFDPEGGIFEKYDPDTKKYQPGVPAEYTLDHDGSITLTPDRDGVVLLVLKSSKDRNDSDISIKRTGYKFLGWAYSAEGEAKYSRYDEGKGYTYNVIAGSEVCDNLGDQGEKKITLYARWDKTKYTVDLDANGGTFKDKDGNILLSGDSININTPDKYGTIVYNMEGHARIERTEGDTEYFFRGWSFDKDAVDPDIKNGGDITGQMVANAIAASKTPADTTTKLYAVWRPDEFRINLDANGGRFQAADADTLTVISSKAKYSSHSEKTACILDHRPEDADFNMTLDMISNIKAKADQVNGSTANLSRENYELAGFGSLPASKTPVTGQVIKADTDEITLYAIWKPTGQAVLRFDPNGANNGENVDPYPGTIDDTINLPVCTYTKKGYECVGWADSKERAADKIVDHEIGSKYTLTKTDQTLYAVWKPVVITVRFELADPKQIDGIKPSSKTSQTVTYEAAEAGSGVENGAGKEALMVFELKMNGYSFDGWSLSAERTNTDYRNVENEYFKTDIYKDAVRMSDLEYSRTLFDVWKPLDCTLTLNYNGGHAADDPGILSLTPEGIKYDSEVDLSQYAPVYPGYKLTGWAGTKEDADKGIIKYKADEILKMADDDASNVTALTLWAVWEESYNVRFQMGDTLDEEGKIMPETAGGAITLNEKEITSDTVIGVQNGDEMSELGIRAQAVRGYEFAGWKYKYSDGGELKISSDYLSNSSGELIKADLSNMVYDGKSLYSYAAEDEISKETTLIACFRKKKFEVSILAGEHSLLQITGKTKEAETAEDAESSTGSAIEEETSTEAAIVPDFDKAKTSNGITETESYYIGDHLYVRLELTKPVAFPMSKMTVTSSEDAKENRTFLFLSQLEAAAGVTSEGEGSYIIDLNRLMGQQVEKTDEYALSGDYKIELACVENEVLPTFTVTTECNAGGKINPVSETANEGSTVTVDVVPYAGYYISSLKLVTDAGTVDRTPSGYRSEGTSIGITTTTKVVAQFSVIPKLYEIKKADTSHGSFSLSCTGQAAEGESVKVTASPDKNYRVRAVYVNQELISRTVPCYFTVREDSEVYVTFEQGGDRYTITNLTTDENGVLSIDDVEYVEKGDDITVSIKPDKGYKISKLYVDGKTVTVTSSYTFTNVKKDHTIRAYFKEGTETYTIKGTAGTGGYLSIGSKSVSQGDDLTVTITPNSGYRISSVLVDGKSVGSVTSYTFEDVNEDHTISASFVEANFINSGQVGLINDGGMTMTASTFTDVSANDWYYQAVKYAVERGLINSTSKSTFSPGQTATRAEIVYMLYQNSGAPSAGTSTSFNDVSSSSWYAKAVSWAARNGIVSGTSTYSFSPNSSVTREQLAAILYRYAGYSGKNISNTNDYYVSSYKDGNQIASYARDALCWNCNNGLISGTSSSQLSPKGSATRAELCQIVMRYNNAV